MKRILLFFVAISMILGWSSCKHGDDYMVFVGTWGVEQIDYYNIDYAGQPIDATMETYSFTPGDPDNGIDLVFRSDRSGEMRDRSRDSLYLPVYQNNTIVDTAVIPCVDTVIVTKYTYSYHDDDAILYMNMEDHDCYFERKTVGETYEDELVQYVRQYTYNMHVSQITQESFIYENEYNKDYVERARLIRLSTENPVKANRYSKPVRVPHKPGSMLGNH